YSVRPAFDMDSIDETDALGICRHHDRMGAFSRTKEPYAAKQRTVGYACCGENDLFARRKIVRVVDLVRVGDTHFIKAFHYFMNRRHLALINAKTLGVEYELCLDLAVQTLHRGGGDNSFRRAANTHECVDVRARNSSRDTGRKVAVRD